MLHQKISALEEKRLQSQPLPTGIAPYTSSSFFKTQSPNSKPKAKRWDHRFSLDTQKQNASVLKAAARTEDTTSIITLGTGRPASGFYPWSSMTMCGKEGSCGRSEKNLPMSCSAGESAYDLSLALNYGYAAGSPQILRFITEHVELIHEPPYADWECSLTCGTTSAIDVALRMFCNRGDWVLVEEYTYSGTIAAVKAQGLNVLGVKMDGRGLVPEDLDVKLRAWDPSKGKKPFVLYTIPSGQNPTGTTQDTERRKAIYEVAEKHDIYIIEDDPYYFLQLGDNTRDDSSIKTSIDEYVKSLPVSYLSLDVSGRVMRLETTSKILAPGLRCGWMTASSQIVDKFLAHTENSTCFPSGPSQVMLYKLLDETWGHEGFLKWLGQLSFQYRTRRNILLDACQRHLPSDICTWTVPSEGMFLWINLDLRQYPEARLECSPHDYSAIEGRIFADAKQKGVLVSKGSWFAANKHRPRDVSFRLTFAAAAQHDLDEAIKRFGETLQ